jgi:hypothetical protein
LLLDESIGPLRRAKTEARIQALAVLAHIKAPRTYFSGPEELHHTTLNCSTNVSIEAQKMSSNQQTSTACCTIPPIIAKDYQHKGDYQTIAGLRTYTTGPAEATHGILMISDVFGFFPQTLQGADILAYADKEKPYRVFMPDWFDGEPMPIEWYPPDTDEKKKNLGHFFETKAAPQRTVAKIPGVVTALQEAAPAIQTWGFLGLCWGAKVGCFQCWGHCLIIVHICSVLIASPTY